MQNIFNAAKTGMGSDRRDQPRRSSDRLQPQLPAGKRGVAQEFFGETLDREQRRMPQPDRNTLRLVRERRRSRNLRHRGRQAVEAAKLSGARSRSRRRNGHFVPLKRDASTVMMPHQCRIYRHRRRRRGTTADIPRAFQPRRGSLSIIALATVRSSAMLGDALHRQGIAPFRAW